MSRKNLILDVKNHFYMWFVGFRTVLVLVKPSKLSWGRTSEVFVPQNGLNVLLLGSELLLEVGSRKSDKLGGEGTFY